METPVLIEYEFIPPGGHVHHTFEITSTAPLEISVVDRHDITAEAVLDKEGWCIILLLTNVVNVPVIISPEEPLRLVIVPAGQAVAEAAAADHGTPHSKPGRI